KIQLERGRKRLGQALTARGCGLGAGLLALAVTSPAGASPRLVQTVLAAVSGTPPPAVAALPQGGTVNPLLHRSPPAVLVLAAVLGMGWGASQLSAVGRPAARVAPAEAGKAKPSPPAKEGTVSGSVLSPAGKPLAGVEVLLVGKGKTPRKLAVTGAD